MQQSKGFNENYSMKPSKFYLFNEYKPKQLQIVNIYIVCVFISISPLPLLSHNFLASQVAMHAVYRLLIACQQN